MRFTLLWRGKRDGFGAGDFHCRCDGHALIPTPVEWESRITRPYFKTDRSLKSFVLTLKNPYNFTARNFVLRVEKKDRVTWCNSERGPHF
jgi:hypothetical protein